MNIRGSSLRSPFGVRNVKVYYDGIPFTDPSGNTYLNALGFYSIGSMEIIKGPAGSMYGAGTGGVLLVEPLMEKGVDVSVIGGSYGLMNVQGAIGFGDSSMAHRISFQQLKSDGYRDHSSMDRKVFQWGMKSRMGKGRLSTQVLYTDLYYQTPGGLTASEYAANPRQARPATMVFPSAQLAKAAIRSRNAFAGIGYEQELARDWSVYGSLYGAYSSIENPTFRNYETRLEPHAGGRFAVKYHRDYGHMKVNWNTGAELQNGMFNIRVSRNVAGQEGATQTNDDVGAWQYFVFSQLSMEFNKGWNVEAGASWNRSGISIKRVSVDPVTKQERKFDNQVAPRIAVNKKLTQDQSIFVSASKGFSPPTAAEVLPSTGEINTLLEAENGWSLEAGYKASLLRGKLSIQLSAFRMRLNNTIALRRDAGGADYFVNAGKTIQQGIELQTSYMPVRKEYGLVRELTIWGSYAYHDLKFKDYIKDTVALEGKRLPGIPPHQLSAGLETRLSKGFYANVNYQYSDNIFLNDQNTVRAGSFHVLSARAGWRWTLSRLRFDLFTAVENITDTRYSAGNDLNAAGGRYYNLAPGRVWSFGLNVRRAG